MYALFFCGWNRRAQGSQRLTKTTRLQSAIPSCSTARSHDCTARQCTSSLLPPRTASNSRLTHVGYARSCNKKATRTALGSLSSTMTTGAKQHSHRHSRRARHRQKAHSRPLRPRTLPRSSGAPLSTTITRSSFTQDPCARGPTNGQAEPR